MSDIAVALRGARGVYPERRQSDEKPLDRWAASVAGRIRGSFGRAVRTRPIVAAAAAAADELRSLRGDQLTAEAQALRPRLRRDGFSVPLAGRVFALVREVAERRLGVRPYDVQLAGGWVMLNGIVAEMMTGEGKTLTATLPACAAALAGIPVHIITVNDYLAGRDAEWMAPIYEGLGLTVGAVTHAVSQDERRHAYDCDVTYATNKEIVFDYLRDRLELGRRPGQLQMRVERLYRHDARLDRLRLRGLCFGIVDEADSVLIDEARTPLIISGPGDNTFAVEMYREALVMSERLANDRDYLVDERKRTVELTERGRDELAALAGPLGGFWRGERRRENLVCKALTARHVFRRDEHYVVKAGSVQIVDEYTGRVLEGRTWEGGLHQLIEAKEDCEVSVGNETLGRISYQRFFRRYLALAGMTGTARETKAELWSVYRLRVVAVPTHRPLIRRELPMQVFRTAEQKWHAVVERIAGFHAEGRPVLVGTRTVADSERLKSLLEQAGLDCRVLNALQDGDEAEVIAGAGERGRITVATNMAGRGTDIKLGDGVAGLGGLHVMATERHDARRIDRQLFGRCGRQGDPGSYEAFVSYEDDLLRAHPPSVRWPPGRVFSAAQRAAERSHYRARRQLLKMDEAMERALAFSGTGE